MRAIWSGTLSIARSDAVHYHPGLPLPLTIRIHPRALRLKLRIDDAGETIVLTCPPRSSRRAALEWVMAQRRWIAERLAATVPSIPLVPGVLIPIEGRDALLAWVEGGSRRVEWSDGVLACGGPREGFSRRIESWLKGRARKLLLADTADAARKAGVTVKKVSIGDARSRWGSCSESGSIRFNWRLVLAPPEVRRWVVAHEVAHRVHMNHGPEFKALETELFDGDVSAVRLLLRRLGPRLKGIGRGL